MSDTCPGEWAEGKAPQLAAEEGGGLAWGGRDDKGRWEVARGTATLPCACCQRRAGNHCHHGKPHLELPTPKRWTTSFKLQLDKVISIKQISIYGLSGCRSKVCDSEHHLSNTAVSQGAEKR